MTPQPWQSASLGIVLAAASTASALPPPSVCQELTHLQVLRTISTVAAMPAPLKASLTKTFHQKSLQLGNPSDLIGSAVTYTGDPENAQSALVFTKRNHLPKLAWGGADLKNLAKSPQELAQRILKGKVWDDEAYIW
jgi:hypothetical protein